ncbi:YczE/YyaS/YitT family protein [Lentibacillus cibarius]|uniref:YitT family protein n=1 Tax=Lentibacillus cibarius TaxID=2583219 RepID=A0A5S3QIL0_9BACI|nr:YitT family protein [Lentibacillus cibarius]TMN21705.1 YitT family protein [Lentibacillus cibarius]
MRRDLVFRWLFFFIGLLVLGLGVALTIKGQRFGVGSWDVLHVGLFKQLGLSIGLWSIIMGILIVTASSIGLRELPKIGTFANLTSVGLFIDFFNWLIPDPHTFLMQFIAFILGVILLAIGCGIYISADLGAGPRDTVMLLLSEKLNWSITFARTFMEIVVAVAGFLLGGPIGVGTVIITFALGPIIQVSLGYSKKVLHHQLECQAPAQF